MLVKCLNSIRLKMMPNKEALFIYDHLYYSITFFLGLQRISSPTVLQQTESYMYKQ